MAIDGQRLMSKTQHYRKVTKPLLERKRRARMNHYLDELKDLIVETMEAQGEHVTKLEKADILEMTVQYLKTKRQIECLPPEAPEVNAEKFQAGYTQAAYEVSKVFASFPGLDAKFGTKLMKHLGYQLKDMKAQPMSPTLAASSAAPSPGPSMHSYCSPAHSPDIQLKRISTPPNHYPKVEEDPHGGDVWRPW